MISLKSLVIICTSMIFISGLASDYLTHNNFINGMVVLSVVGIDMLIITIFYKRHVSTEVSR